MDRIYTLGLFLFFTHLVNSKDPVDGQWTSWSVIAVDECSKKCGGGTFSRKRTCANPSPENGGRECLLSDGVTYALEELKEFPCNTHLCTIDGSASQWAEWTACSTVCGRGQEKRSKECVSGADGYFCLLKENTEFRPCNTWNKTTCPRPCEAEQSVCPPDSICDDRSNEEDPIASCRCVMGNILSPDGKRCIAKPLTTTTPRPIPTLSVIEKKVSIVITKTASTILLVFVGTTLAIFLFMRIFTHDRVIQMNMELALLIAHLLLLVPSETAIDHPVLCRVIAIGLHYFFTACFAFMFLEALHMYSLVAFVVPKSGMLGRLSNTLIGWGIPAFVILFSVCFHYDQYGGAYHCWLDWNRIIAYAELIPIILLSLLTLILTEAAGAAEYKALNDINRTELLSAKISQRSNLILMPMLLASWIIGFLSEYEQNIGLYSTFSILNAVIGGLVFFFHSTGNQQVREKLKEVFSCCIKSVKK